MSIDLTKIESAVDHFASGFASFTKGLIHVVAFAAPIAGKVADLVGSPEVGAIADEVGQVASQADSAVNQDTANNSPTKV